MSYDVHGQGRNSKRVKERHKLNVGSSTEPELVSIADVLGVMISPGDVSARFCKKMHFFEGV